MGKRNNRGFGLPVEPSADTEPISTWLNPNDSRKGMAFPLLSYPAAKPIGLSNSKDPICIFKASFSTEYKEFKVELIHLDFPKNSPQAMEELWIFSGSV